MGHLSRLIDDLVDVSRITRGTISLQRKALDIGGIVAEAIEASRPIIDDRQHTLVVNLPEEPMIDLGDARDGAGRWPTCSQRPKFTPKGGQITVTWSNATAQDMVCA